jgi:hypothetical protein
MRLQPCLTGALAFPPHPGMRRKYQIHKIEYPPSIKQTAPVTYEEASDAK